MEKKKMWGGLTEKVDILVRRNAELGGVLGGVGCDLSTDTKNCENQQGNAAH